MMKKTVSVLIALIMVISMAACSAPAASQETADAEITEANSTAAALSPSAQPAETAAATPAPTVQPPIVTPSPEVTASAPAVKAPEPGKAVIVFTFDDGPVSDYLLAYPILKKYGIKGTSYIITKFTDKKTKGKMTWDQIKEMYEYGWVFGAHTYGHNNLRGMSSKKIKSDCEKVNQSFIDQGLPPPEIIAYPYGTYNSRVIKAIKPFYRQARLAYYRTDLVNPTKTNPYKIPSVSADMQSKSKLKRLERLVDKACKKGRIIVFRVHALYKKHSQDTVKRMHMLSGYAPQTSSKLFAKLVKYCVDKGCVFMTMTELMDYMEAQKAAR